MKLSPAFANLAWAASNWPGFRQFRRALAHPEETQLAVLRQQLANHAGSAYGRAHVFAKIRSYDDFTRRVPLVDYEDIESWIDRIRRGEPRVLTSDPVRHLIPTSGSTGARKLIPFTAGLQREFGRALAPWIADLFRQHPNITFGSAYWSISPALRLDTEEASAVPIGFEHDSGYLGGVRQRLVNSVMAAPSALRLVRDMGTFRYLTLLSLLRRCDLRLISVWHPSFLTLLLETLPKIWDELLSDLHTGQCRRAIDSVPEVHEAFRASPSPRRAKELQRADPRQPEMLWPSLKVISCWRDARADLGARQLARHFPNTLIQPKGLLATEAFVTIPFAGQHPVAIRSHFFEFIDDDENLRLAHQLREDESYDVVVTTAGGLWRYRLRDRVLVTGFVQRTPSLRFLGKSGIISDQFGEKLSEAFVGEVIREMAATLPAPPQFALLAPDEDMLGLRYTLYLEGPSCSELAGRIDAALRRNPHYAWCRDLGQLLEPRVVEIRYGGYETFVAREMQIGRRFGEIKPSALSTRSGWSEYFQCVASSAKAGIAASSNSRDR